MHVVFCSGRVDVEFSVEVDVEVDVEVGDARSSGGVPSFSCFYGDVGSCTPHPQSRL